MVDITADIVRFCSARGDGLCHILAPHATAGLAMMEVGSASEDDLRDLLARLIPRDDRYRHRHGSLGHGADHLLPALLSPTLVLAVTAGRPQLGTWQSVVLVDTNVDNPNRTVRLSFLPG
ncbi:MAG TPA: YjbQ family protein [Acidimicrobiales bacterium]|nr:YjbQ family protein [Acidimicrobiales bacterium]